MTELSDMQKILAAMEALRTQMNTQFAVMRTDMTDMEWSLRNEISGARRTRASREANSIDGARRLREPTFDHSANAYPLPDSSAHLAVDCALRQLRDAPRDRLSGLRN